MLSCGSNSDGKSNPFSISIKNEKKAYVNTETIAVSILSRKNNPIEAITYTIDGVEVESVNGNREIQIALSGKKLGKRKIIASIAAGGSSYEATTEITLVAAQKPKLYTYAILESYPHDKDAYTQGLEFVNDTLYESTGLYNESSLRKTDYKTGKVLQHIALKPEYFGEGITIMNKKIYQLTYRENIGFIYDLHSMKQKGTFVYDKSLEGWGLCNNNNSIFKSDGTEKIWMLNKETLSEEGFIEIYTNTSKINSVNELEWVEGKIYANIYEQNAIAIIDPSNGAVEGVINLKGLQEMVTQHPGLNVLNGIAYKGEKNIIYITGKKWDRLFKIEIIEKQ